ncbi:hypothetical protein ACO22_03789 [Paracoccidioides brasiliensis]|nr:hypothetical protein ACO22_03789 [Paracoccidioides brasiliensis]
MPSRLTAAVLSVDAGKMHEVDTRNAESLHGMWMVFSKCADFMEEGRRLENLSWRLWTRETFCVEPLQQEATQLEIRSLRCGSREIPELSSSVESVESDEAEQIETHIKPSQALDVKPAIVEDDSALSISRGKEKHITSLGLERMVYNIKEKKCLEPLSLPNTPSQRGVTATAPVAVDLTPGPSMPAPTPIAREPQQVLPHQSSDSCSTAALDGLESDHTSPVGSDTSFSSSGRVESTGIDESTRIVRGFSPSQISSSYRSRPHVSSSPTSSNTSVPVTSSPLKKAGGMFTLGGSSGEDESSFEDRMTEKPQRSSLSDGLQQTGSPMKMALVKNSMESTPVRTISEGSDDEDAIETDDDDEEISESAIEDDDSSEWEDSVTESGRSSVDEKELFQRVDSRPNLVSRRSLLTMMIHQPQRTMNGQLAGKSTCPAGSRSTPALQQSHLASPNEDSATGSIEDDENTLTMKGPDVPRSKPIIVKSMPTHQIPHSPRTTRRNMLATELTESLRRHLLWERQQKTTPGFKRRHTAYDMGNLQEFPGSKNNNSNANMDVNVNLSNMNGVQTAQRYAQNISSNSASRDKETSKNSSWNHYFDYGPWEYHVKGW